MSDDRPRVSRDGIYIPPEVAAAEALPDDLDASQVGPYRFPDPRRRRIAGWIYLGLAALFAVGLSSRPTLAGGLAIALGLAAWSFAAAWPMRVEDREALATAASHVPFPVGAVSAAVAFVGIRARPRWQVIVYSADDPPTRRALVQIDAVDGSLVEEPYIEEIPAPGP